MNDPEVANDLTAKTFAQVLVSLGRFRGEQPGEGVAWLWGIARNLLRQQYRTARLETSARRRLGVPVRSYDAHCWDDVDARASASGLAHELTSAMAALTPGERRAITMTAVTLLLVALLKNSELRSERAIQEKPDALATAMLEERRSGHDEAAPALHRAIGLEDEH